MPQVIFHGLSTIPLRTRLWILFGFGLAARIAVSLFFADNHTLYFEHMLIAQNLLEGKGYSWDEWGAALLQPSSLVVPLYVYWCLFFEWIAWNNFLPMYVCQAVVAALGCFPAYRIGERMHSTRLGIVFACLYAFYPEFVFMHSRAVAESIYVTLCLWIIERYLALRRMGAGSERTIRTAAMMGVICGIAMLVKEAAAVVAGSVLIATVVHTRLRWIAVKSHVIPLVCAAGIILSPWFIRNYIVQGEFVPLRTAYGVNLWVSNHHGAAGNDRYANGEFVFFGPAHSAVLKRLPKDEQDRERAYIAEVIDFIKTQPAEYVSLCFKRLHYWVWVVTNNPRTQNPIYQITWLLVLILSIPGYWILRKTGKMDRVFPLIIVGYMLLYVPAIVLPRYRVVTAAICLLFAAAAIDHLWSYWRAKHMMKVHP